MSTASTKLPRVGAMLRVVSNSVRDRVFDAVVAAGFDDLNPAHVQMFRYPGLDGMRPSQVAAELQITADAGHAAFEPANSRALVAATDRFALRP